MIIARKASTCTLVSLVKKLLTYTLVALIDNASQKKQIPAGNCSAGIIIENPTLTLKQAEQPAPNSSFRRLILVRRFLQI
jgi:hypothetical protein